MSTSEASDLKKIEDADRYMQRCDLCGCEGEDLIETCDGCFCSDCLDFINNEKKEEE